MDLNLHIFKMKFTKYTKKGVRKNSAFFREYGDMYIMQAYNIFKAAQEKKIRELKELKEKINAFENFLIKQGAFCTQSNVSESRYYYYNNKKYRFSNHIYPTGSMTNDLLGVVDLAADPELINEVEY